MAGESLKCKCLLWILILWLFFNGLRVKRGVVGLAAGICITTWFSFCPSWHVLRNHDSRTLCGETRTSCNVQQVICTPAWTHWITGRSGFCKPKTLMGYHDVLIYWFSCGAFETRLQGHLVLGFRLSDTSCILFEDSASGRKRREPVSSMPAGQRTASWCDQVAQSFYIILTCFDCLEVYTCSWSNIMFYHLLCF